MRERWAYFAAYSMTSVSIQMYFRACCCRQLIGDQFEWDQPSDHSTAGAQHAFSTAGRGGTILAYAIAGHHAGLLDGKGSDGSLEKRLKKVIPDFSAAPASILNSEKFDNLPFAPDAKHFSFQAAFFIRMVFSCLVDADFLDTEAFMDKETFLLRSNYPSIAELRELFIHFMDERYSPKPDDTPVNHIRSNILRRCIEKAAGAPGAFTLSVPTGGGKTLSSMAFALHHATHHQKRRIIYVIPYISIIEQTADQFQQYSKWSSNITNLEPAEENEATQKAITQKTGTPIIVTMRYSSLNPLASRTTAAANFIILSTAWSFSMKLNYCRRSFQPDPPCSG